MLKLLFLYTFRERFDLNYNDRFVNLYYFGLTVYTCFTSMVVFMLIVGHNTALPYCHSNSMHYIFFGLDLPKELKLVLVIQRLPTMQRSRRDRSAFLGLLH